MMSGSPVRLRIQGISSPVKQFLHIVSPSEHYVTYRTRPGLGIRLWTVHLIY